MNINDLMEKNKEFNIEEYRVVNKSVIYFICETDGSIVYIGSAMNLHIRIQQHSARIDFYNKPVFFFFCPIKKYRILEQKLIRQIKPKYNINGVKEHNISNYVCISTEEREYKIAKSTEKRKTLSDIMIQKKITQSHLAKMMNTSRQRINQLLNSERRLYDKTTEIIEGYINQLSSL